MSGELQSSPLDAVDRDDPGDETFRRFRYQATYTAAVAVGLLNDLEDALEIYCEQYEDILLRLRSGKFRGIQVKTKEDDSGQAFRATDEQVLSALVRFVELDLAFPDQFESFCLASNVPFDRSGRGHGNAHAVIAEARERRDDPNAACPKACGLAKTLIARIKRSFPKAKPKTKTREHAIPQKSGVEVTAAAASQPHSEAGSRASAALPTEADVLRVLGKLEILSDLPKLSDIRSRLRETLIRLSSRVANSTVPAVERVVDALELAAYRAASRSDEDRNGRYWFVGNATQRERQRAADEIAGKRFTRLDIEAVISYQCTGALLVSADAAHPAMPADLSLLDKKLVAGGLSVATLGLAHDAVASVEELGSRLLYQYDGEEGLLRYNHARAVAKKEAALAYETQSGHGVVNGPRMLAEIEARLKQRRADDTSGVLAECQEEHLLGHVFYLTSECVVWWSTARDLGVAPLTPPKGRDD